MPVLVRLQAPGRGGKGGMRDDKVGGFLPLPARRSMTLEQEQKVFSGPVQAFGFSLVRGRE